MNFVTVASFLYCLSPLVALLLVAGLRRSKNAMNWVGTGLGVIRLLFLIPIIDAVLIHATKLQPAIGFIDEFAIRVSTDWSGHRIWFLLVVDCCFLMSYFMRVGTARHQILIEMMLYACQAVITLYVITSNLLLANAMQASTALILFFIVRLSLGEKSSTSSYISNRVLMTYACLAILGIVWSISEYTVVNRPGFPILELSPTTGASSLAIRLWMIALLFSVPLSPWSSWFNRAVVDLPEAVTMALVVFVSAVILRAGETYVSVYTDIPSAYKLLIYLTGVMGCVFSLASLFTVETRRAMLGCIPKFFLSLVLVGIGVARGGNLAVVYLLCLFIPIFCGVILYSSSLSLNTNYQRVFVGIFLLFLIGFPGSPAYQIFSLVGGRSLEMGPGYALIFAVLWFFYFFSIVFICRRIFLDEETAAVGVETPLSKAPVLMTSYAIFMLLFMSFIALVSGRVS